MSIRSFLYRVARGLGDFNALKRGPTAVAKRSVRKVAQKGFSKALTRLLKWG